MDKKWIALICIIIIVVIALGAFYTFSTPDKVKVGDSTFKIPEGYHVDKSEDNNVTNLTDGKHNIYIKKYDDKKIQKHIESYINRSELKNKTVKISNFTVGKTLVYKTTLNGTNTIHYWFVKNNNTYNIYSGDKNPKIDSIVVNLIETVK